MPGSDLATRSSRSRSIRRRPGVPTSRCATWNGRGRVDRSLGSLSDRHRPVTCWPPTSSTGSRVRCCSSTPTSLFVRPTSSKSLRRPEPVVAGVYAAKKMGAARSTPDSYRRPTRSTRQVGRPAVSARTGRGGLPADQDGRPPAADRGQLELPFAGYRDLWAGRFFSRSS